MKKSELKKLYNRIGVSDTIIEVIKEQLGDWPGNTIPSSKPFKRPRPPKPDVSPRPDPPAPDSGDDSLYEGPCYTIQGIQCAPCSNAMLSGITQDGFTGTACFPEEVWATFGAGVWPGWPSSSGGDCYNLMGQLCQCGTPGCY